MVSSTSPCLRFGSSRSLARNGISHELRGLAVGEAEALVEQRRAHRRTTTVRSAGGGGSPSVPGVERRVVRVALRVRLAAHQALDLVGEGSERVGELGPVGRRSTVNAAISPCAGCGRGDAGLVLRRRTRCTVLAAHAARGPAVARPRRRRSRRAARPSRPGAAREAPAPAAIERVAGSALVVDSCSLTRDPSAPAHLARVLRQRGQVRLHRRPCRRRSAPS